MSSFILRTIVVHTYVNIGDKLIILVVTKYKKKIVSSFAIKHFYHSSLVKNIMGY